MKQVHKLSDQEAARLKNLGWKEMVKLCSISGVDWYTVWEAPNA